MVLKDIKSLQSDISSTQNTLRGGGTVDNQSIQTLQNMQNELRQKLQETEQLMQSIASSSAAPQEQKPLPKNEDLNNKSIADLREI